ncbi:MAG: PE domain-containing protein [Pseudonocardiaceae bacterium]
MEPTAGPSFQVNPDNVLQAHKIMQDAANRLTDGIAPLRATLRLDEMGGDPVSREAAAAFTHRMSAGESSYLAIALQFRDELQRGANALRQSALEYGWTDEDIARGFPPGGANV